MTREPAARDAAGSAELLGTSAWMVRWWALTRRFPRPSSGAAGGGGRDEAEVWTWALREGMSDRVPLSNWPDASRPAGYLGAAELPGSIAQRWRTEVGDLEVVWPLPDTARVPRDELVDHLAGAAGIVCVDHDFGPWGPSLTGLVPAVPGRTYGLRWSKLSRVIGMPVPYWPTALRLPELLDRWRPGAPEVTAPAAPDLDTAAMLRLAATYEDGHPAAQVLVNLARVSQHRATDWAGRDLETVERLCRDEATVVFPARPMPVPAADREDLEQLPRRAGWLDILSRTDTLAARCVLQVAMQDGGADLPFTANIDLPSLETPTAREWARRLEPVPARTAAFELLGDREREGELLVDPATDAPAIRTTHPDGRVALRALSPQRLPATAPLAEVILDDPIWVRTEDGVIYPAPASPSAGVSWGYPGGSGPATFALLIGRLLEDITAQAPSAIAGAPEGLDELTQFAFPAGTVLTRAQLEAARAGRWRPWDEGADPPGAGTQ